MLIFLYWTLVAIKLVFTLDLAALNLKTKKKSHFKNRSYLYRLPSHSPALDLGHQVIVPPPRNFLLSFPLLILLWFLLLFPFLLCHFYFPVTCHCLLFWYSFLTFMDDSRFCFFSRRCFLRLSLCGLLNFSLIGWWACVCLFSRCVIQRGLLLVLSACFY